MAVQRSGVTEENIANTPSTQNTVTPYGAPVPGQGPQVYQQCK